MRIFPLAVAFAFATLAVTPAQAQEVGITNPEVSTDTVMYFHPIDIQDFPINTQEPDPAWTETSSYGTATPTLTCVVKPLQGTEYENFLGMGTPYHTWRGYSSPSYVEYDSIENGKPRTHPERGISYDAIFDQSKPFDVYWYLRTDTMIPVFPDESVDNQAPVIIPNIVVMAQLRAGDQISIDDKAYDSGERVALGITPVGTLAPGQSPGGVQDHPTEPGDAKEFVRYVGNTERGHIYEFRVPMTFETDKVTRANGFNIRIDAFIYSDGETCHDMEDGNAMAHTVVAYSGKINSAEDDPTGRPRLKWSIMNPIRLEYLHPQFVGDDLVIHTSMNSAWGNYDVKEETIQVRVEGPSAATQLARAAIVQRTHEHYHHQEAVDVTYVWPYKQDRAQNGLYTVYVEFENDQSTAKASGIAQFELGKGRVIGCGGVQESAQKISDDCGEDVQPDGASGSKESPGIEVLGILAALGAAVLALRRRSA